MKDVINDKIIIDGIAKIIQACVLMNKLIHKVNEVAKFPDGRETEGALNFIKQAVEDKLAFIKQNER